MQQDHIRALDGLRGFAALIVVFSHFSGLTGWLNYWPGTLAAHIGVMIFFVLSGFLMGYLTMGRSASPQTVMTFMKRRVARVVPLYMFIVFVSFGLSAPQIWWRYRLYKVNTGNIWDHLFFIRGESVLWTIPVEIQFYLLFAVVFWTASTLLKQWAWVLTAACLILFKMYPYFLWRATGIALFSHAIGFFLAGLLIAQIYPWLTRLPAWFWNAAFVIGLAAVPILYPRVFMELTGNMVGWEASAIGTYIYTSNLYLAVCALLVAAASISTLAKTTMGSGPLVWCGKVSFSLYLLHMPVLWMLNRFTVLNHQPWLFLYNALPLIFLAAWLSYRFIEKPARSAINSLSYENVWKLSKSTLMRKSSAARPTSTMQANSVPPTSGAARVATSDPKSASYDLVRVEPSQ